MHSSAPHPSLEDSYWYRMLVEQVPAIIYVCEFGPTGRWHYVSPQIETLLHYTAQEWIANPRLWLERIHPEDYSLVLAQEKRHWQEGDRYLVEYRILARDGRVIWLRDEAIAFRDPATDHLLMRGVMLDITDRIGAEREILARTQQQGVIAELGLFALASKDLSPVFEKAVAAVAKTLEVELCKVLQLLPDGKELLLRTGVGWHEGLVGRAKVKTDTASQAGYTLRSSAPVIVEDGCTETRFALPPLLLDHGVVSGISVLIPGQVRPFGVLGAHTQQRRTFTHDDANFLQSIANVLAQQIERNQFEEDLRKSEERFSKAFRSSPLAITISSKTEGRYLDVNEAFLRLLGYHRQDVIGRTATELNFWIEPQRRLEMLQQLGESGRVTAFPAQYTTSRGEIRQAEVSAELIDLEGHSCVLAITRDTTETQRLEAQFRHAQKMEIVGRLAGGIAHDFNNLMGVILGYSDLLSIRLNPTDSGRKQVQEIKKAGERAVALTRQLLAFSRQQVMQTRILDLNLVVSDVEKMLHRLISEDIVLRIEKSDRLDHVKTDSGQMEQVIMNLVVNARDAMPQGGTITIRTVNAQLDDNDRRAHPYVRPGSYVLLSVADSGIGMDAETLSHIFEPFFTTKEPGKGTGLGLATVYGIVKQSGGYVWAESEVGQGTTFKVYLPRIQAPPEKASGKEIVTNSCRGTETVLVVEDEEALREVTCAFLKSAGYSVLEASNGAQALEIARDQAEVVHLLLTDMIMPGMSGHELAGRVAALNPKIKLAYVSGYTDHASLHRGLPDEDTPFLSKPFTRQGLLEKVRRILESD
jgi:two-component system, cell cycle sensor histidine kinase and response regulator CckA